MKGNFQVRFLGEKGGVILSTYPTYSQKNNVFPAIVFRELLKNFRLLPQLKIWKNRVEYFQSRQKDQK